MPPFHIQMRGGIVALMYLFPQIYEFTYAIMLHRMLRHNDLFFANVGIKANILVCMTVVQFVNSTFNKHNT